MKIENTSGIHPKGKAVLLEPYEPEIRSSVIELPANVSLNVQVADVRGRVIEIGAIAWENEPEPRAKVGDKVLIAKYVGVMMRGPLDDKQYRIINAEDIYATIEDKEK